MLQIRYTHDVYQLADARSVRYGDRQLMFDRSSPLSCPAKRFCHVAMGLLLLSVAGEPNHLYL